VLQSCVQRGVVLSMATAALTVPIVAPDVFRLVTTSLDAMLRILVHLGQAVVRPLASADLVLTVSSSIL